MGEGTQSARVLALWTRAEPTSPASFAMDEPLSPARSERDVHVPAFRHQPADLLSLVAPLRSARPEHPGRSLASPTPPAATGLERRSGAGCARSAPGISSLVQGQAGGTALPQRASSFHFHGGSHPRRSEAPRGVDRSTGGGRSTQTTEETARSALGLAESLVLGPFSNPAIWCNSTPKNRGRGAVWCGNTSPRAMWSRSGMCWKRTNGPLRWSRRTSWTPL